MNSNFFIKFSFSFLLSIYGEFISQAHAETNINMNEQLETNSSRILNSIQENLTKGLWIIKCQSQFLDALSQQSTVILNYDQTQKKLNLDVMATNDIISLSLNSKDSNNQINNLVHSQSGFIIQNNICDEKSKIRTDFSYLEQKGSGILGSESPLAILRAEKSKRELSLSSSCSSNKINDCSCTDSEYLLRDQLNLECGIYKNPYTKVTAPFTSKTLEQIATSIANVDTAIRASINSNTDVYAKLQTGTLNKYHITNNGGKIITSSMLWNSIPYFTEESTLNSLSTQLTSEQNPSEEMIYAGLMFNSTFDSQTVKNMIEIIRKNPHLKFYHFNANSSIAEHSLHGWLLIDTITGELYIAKRVKNYLLERELFLKNQQTNPQSGILPGADDSDDKSTNASNKQVCQGTNIVITNTKLQQKGDLSKCFLKNNPTINDTKGSAPIQWDQVLNSFLKGSEISADSSFEAPGVCYDLDGIPHHTPTGELGETKRAPNYIVKMGTKVALYSHQVLERTGHGVWPIGEAACTEKEKIYQEGAIATMAWAKKNDFKTEALSIEAHPNQCFTYYQGALNYSTQGITRFFLRKTPFGIIMVWPRPSLSIDRLDDLSLMCIFPSRALKTTSAVPKQ